MTDSNIALMSKLDILPSSAPNQGIATNYIDEEAIEGRLKGVEASIDQTSKWNEQQANSLIKMYHHMFNEQKGRPKALMDLLKQGKETGQEIGEFYEYWDKYYQYANRLRDQKTNHVNILGGDNWASYQGKGEFDSDVKAEIDAKDRRAAVKAESMDLAADLTNQGYHFEGRELSRGPDGAYEKENEIFENTDQLMLHYKHHYRPAAEAAMKIRMPGQFTPDGTPIYKTYAEANGPEERRYLNDVIDSWFAYEYEGLAGGRAGLFKQKVINNMIEDDDLRLKKYTEEAGAAFKEIAQENRYKELQVQIKNDPSYLVTYIQTYKGTTGSYGNARREGFDTLIRGVETYGLRRADIEPVLDYSFHAHDSTPENPHIVTARDYWKKDTRRLLKALAKAEKDEATEDENMKDGEMKSRAMQIREDMDNSDAPYTFQAVNDIQLNFAKEFGLRPEQLPDIIKNLPYEGMYDDQALNDDLMWRHYTLNQQITANDIRGFTDPALRKKWFDIVKMGTGLSQQAKTLRDNAVKAEVSARTLESDLDKAKTPKWTSNYEQAIMEYDSVYNGIIDNNGSPRDAHREAMKAVKDGLWKEVSPGVYQWDTRQESKFDPQPAQEINNMVSAIGKDRNLINSPDPWVGEEPHLKEAGRYFELSRKGRQVDIPAYYRRIADQIGLNPERLMLNRLQQTGRLKEGDVEIPEEKILDVGHQRLLLQPTAARTYRVALENKDIKALIDMTGSPVAEAHGGYTAIADADGNYVSIEEVVGKPLAEITHSDVLSLLQEGYQNIGNFDLTPRGYMQILADNNLNLNTPWNEDTQDAFFIHKLRSTAQRNQRFSTLYNYNRLVNLPLEDIEEFKEITGSDLPRWNQLDTLSAEAAKLLIELLLSEPEQVN